MEKHWSRRILESMEYVSCLIPNCYSSFTQFTHTYITLNIIRIKMAISAQTTATASYKLSLANVWAQWPKTNNFIQDSRIIFAKCWVHYRIQKHHPYKMSNIKFVQSCWNFAQLRKIKKISKWLKFEVLSSINKKFGQQCTFQNVWKILLWKNNWDLQKCRKSWKKKILTSPVLLLFFSF